MTTMKRTATCGDLGEQDIDSRATLAGWVASNRDHGGLVFIDLRDRYGVTQVVFNPEVDAAHHERARRLRHEDVIQVIGPDRCHVDLTYVVEASGGGQESKLGVDEIVEVNVLQLERKISEPAA